MVNRLERVASQLPVSAQTLLKRDITGNELGPDGKRDTGAYGDTVRRHPVGRATVRPDAPR
jgi:hypothetical protein